MVAVKTELHPFFAEMAKKKSFKIEFKSHPHPRNLHQHDGAESPHCCSLDTLLQRLRAIDAQDDKLANIMDVVGEFGTFQRRLVALSFIPSFLSSFFMFADIFMFAPQKPYCNTSWILAVDRNLSEAEQMNLTLPRAPNGSFLTCLMYVPVDWDLDSTIQFDLNHTDSCQNGWIYPESKRRSLINEVCLVLSCLKLPQVPRDVSSPSLNSGGKTETHEGEAFGPRSARRGTARAETGFLLPSPRLTDLSQEARVGWGVGAGGSVCHLSRKLLELWLRLLKSQKLENWGKNSFDLVPFNNFSA